MSISHYKSYNSSKMTKRKVKSENFYSQKFYLVLDSEIVPELFKSKGGYVHMPVDCINIFDDGIKVYSLNSKGFKRSLHYGNYLQEVTIPKFTPVITNKYYFISSLVYFGNRYHYLDDHDKILNIFRDHVDLINMYTKCYLVMKSGIKIGFTEPNYITNFIIKSIRNNTLDENTIKIFGGISKLIYDFKEIYITHSHLKEKNILLSFIKDKYIPSIQSSVIKPKLPKIINFEAASNNLRLDILQYGLGPLFLHILNKTGSIISGSYVLKLLLNESYVNDDIDIYCNYLSLDDILNFFKRNGIPYYVKRKNDSIYNMSGIQKIFTIHLVSTKTIPVKLQFICLEANVKPIEFIDKNFDFSFCKAYFDGSTIQLPPSVNISDISNMTGSITKSYMNKSFIDTDGYSNYRICKTIERSIKYIKRGFTITNLNEFIDKTITYFYNTSLLKLN